MRNLTDKYWITPIDMFKYYVYLLFDEKGLPFYVGRGYRINSHLKPCNRKIKNFTYNKINKLIEFQGYVKRDILAYFDKEDDAYAFEEYMIQMYGLRSEGGLLTNQLKDRNSFTPRARKKSKESIVKMQDEEIINLHNKYLNGSTLRSLVDVIGYSMTSLAQIFNGHKRKYLKLSNKDRKIKNKIYDLDIILKVIRLRDQGNSYDAISRITSIPKSTVSRFISNRLSYEATGSGNGTSTSVASEDTSVNNLAN